MMKIVKVIEQKENPLFKRKEVKLIVESNKNPTIAEAENAVAEKFSCPLENIKVKSIKGKFGRNTFKISANVYTSEKDKQKTEPKAKVKEDGKKS